MLEELGEIGCGLADRRQPAQGPHHAGVEEVELGGLDRLALDGARPGRQLERKERVAQHLVPLQDGLARHLRITADVGVVEHLRVGGRRRLE